MITTSQKKQLLLMTIVMSLLFIPSIFANELNHPKRINFTKTTQTIQSKIDNGLVLKIEIVDSKRLLRVSFNGSEGPEGELKLYNSTNEMVIESNFELIKSPFYATVDISSLPAGTYTAKLTTGIAIHSSSLIVQ
jgi:hypothetical protein